MPTSIRQSIVTAVDTRLKTILIAGGYETNLGQHVYEYRDPDLEESILPACVWRDTDCDDSNATIGTVGYHLHALKMELNLYASSASTTATTLRKLIADVQKAIGVDTTWGSLANRTNPISNNIVVEQAERIIGQATVTFTIEFYTKKWNPYA